MKQYAVIVEWLEGNRAYTLLKLDESRKPYEAETIYAGSCSQSELLRGWLSHVYDLKGDSDALVYTNHVISRTKPYLVSVYSGIETHYDASYKQKYKAASYLTIEAIKAEEGNG